MRILLGLVLGLATASTVSWALEDVPEPKNYNLEEKLENLLRDRGESFRGRPDRLSETS